MGECRGCTGARVAWQLVSARGAKLEGKVDILPKKILRALTFVEDHRQP